MENPMPSTQTPLLSHTTPLQSPPQTSPKQRYILAVLIGVIALCIVVGSGGYYLGRKNQNNRPVIVSSLAPTSIQISLTPTKPAEESTPTMLPDWKYETDSECGVTMPIPPAESPYITSSIGEHDMDAGHIWILTHAGAYPELIAKVADTYESIHTYAAMFGSTKRSLGSGYISSMVTVHCAPNSNGYNNDQLVTVLKEKLNEYNKIPHQSEHGKQPDRYVLTSVIDGKRWGQNVVDIQFDEVSDTGEKVSKNNTMFSTPTHIYQINIDGQSQNSFIKETAQKIFENLLIKNLIGTDMSKDDNTSNASVTATEGWKTYTNSKYGISFKYPDDYQVEERVDGFFVIFRQHHGLSIDARQLLIEQSSLTKAIDWAYSALNVTQKSQFGNWIVFYGIGKENMLKDVEIKHAVTPYRNGVISVESSRNSISKEVFESIVKSIQFAR